MESRAMDTNISRQARDLNAENTWPRRRLLQAGCASVLGLTFGSPLANAMYHVDPPAEPDAAAMAPTPECRDGDEPTPRQGAGPFYTPDSPQRANLIEPGLPGTPLVLVGHVLQTSCQPIAGVLLDFWQADDEGRYDNQGYTLRGHHPALLPRCIAERARFHLSPASVGAAPRLAPPGDEGAVRFRSARLIPAYSRKCRMGDANKAFAT
jgi:protocatechuate 3,4-dioxygenase beta subunit